MRRIFLPCLAGVAALLAACGGPPEPSGRDKATLARLRANLKVEREARHDIAYICRAEQRTESLGAIQVHRHLTRAGAPGAVQATWDLWARPPAVDERSDSVRLFGVWNSEERDPGALVPRLLSLHWDLYPPVTDRHPRIRFRTMDGEEVALAPWGPGASGNEHLASIYLNWEEARRAETKAHGLIATIEGGPSADRRLFPLGERTLASVEAIVRELANRTAADARDHRARCEAIEQVPTID